MRQPGVFQLKLTILSKTILFILLATPAFYNLISSQPDSSSLTDSQSGDNDPLELDIDGFTIDGSLADTISDELFAKEEEEQEHESPDSASKVKLEFAKTCPHGFFMCTNGECISPKWRCDGAYDCDDFSDELDCTGIADPKKLVDPIIHIPTPKPTSTPAPTSPAKPTDMLKGLTFNSTEEPLMLFSTGIAIRGLWMKKRIYFDVVSSGPKPPKPEPTSITQALSVFFDILNLERLTTPSLVSTSKQQNDDETVPKAKSTIVGVDMDPDSKEVFWVELGRNAGVFSTVIENEQFEARHRRQFVSKHNAVVDSGLLAPEDIALDYIAKNLYITDAGLPAIVVCSVRHSDCKIIVKDNLHKPRALLVDSLTGWITYSDWGDHPGIFLVTMDGKRRETLIDTEVVWPNGLAADPENNHLYWADARLSKIERIDLSTRKRKIIVQENHSNPFSLAIFENRLYWSDWFGNSIKTCDKTIGDNSSRVLMYTDNIYGIHIFHPSLSGMSSEHSSNPCWSKHCTHLCLLSPGTSSSKYQDKRPGSIVANCACPDSMMLSVKDKSTCYEIQFSFLLINVKNYIAQVFPDRIGLHIVEKVIYSKDHIIHDVASDWLNHRLFFFDVAKQHIYMADLSEKKFKIEPFFPTSQSVRGLLYDAWSDNLYWLDSGRGTLSMASVKGKFELVIRKDLGRPISMVLDSRHRVFYVALLGSTPHIMRTDINGNEASDLMIIGTDIGLPVALHLDEKQQRLYWADARRESIESVDLEINQPSGIKYNSRIVHRRKLGVILAFSVYQNHFLWTIKNGDYLYRAKIPTSHDDDHSVATATKSEESKPVTFKLPPNPSAKDPSSDNKRIILVDPIAESGHITSPCHSKGCSHGCVLDSSNIAICVCPEAYKLQGINKTSCLLAPHQYCGPNMFKCLDTSHCVLNSWKCDGTTDCDDGSDEKGCHLKPECPSGDFTCKNGHCIAQAWRCDSFDDCGDNSDEVNCPKRVESYHTKIPTNHGDDHSVTTATKSEESKLVTLKPPPNPSAKDSSSDNKKIILVDPTAESGHDTSPCHSKGCSYGCALDSSNIALCVCPDGEVLSTDKKTCIPFILAESMSQQRSEPSRLVWVFIFLIPLSLAVIVLVSLFLYRKGRLPSNLSVSFVSYDKDAMLLVDDA